MLYAGVDVSAKERN